MKRTELFLQQNSFRPVSIYWTTTVCPAEFCVLINQNWSLTASALNRAHCLVIEYQQFFSSLELGIGYQLIPVLKVTFKLSEPRIARGRPSILQVIFWTLSDGRNSTMYWQLVTTTCGILEENSLDFIESKCYRVRHKGICLITTVPYKCPTLDVLPKLNIIKRCAWGPWTVALAF